MLFNSYQINFSVLPVVLSRAGSVLALVISLALASLVFYSVVRVAAIVVAFNYVLGLLLIS